MIEEIYKYMKENDNFSMDVLRDRLIEAGYKINDIDEAEQIINQEKVHHEEVPLFPSPKDYE